MILSSYMHAENKISYRKGKVYLLCFCMFEIRWFLWLTFTNRSWVGPSYASCLGVEDTNGPSLSNEHKTVVAREFHCCTDGIGSLLRRNGSIEQGIWGPTVIGGSAKLC